MLFSRDYLLERNFFHKELNPIAQPPSEKPQTEQGDEADLSISLIAQDDYGNRERKQKFVKIRQLQSELSQYIHYFNSITFMFFLQEELRIIKDLVTEAAVSGTWPKDLKPKINNVEKEYGVSFKFKNEMNLIELLREVLEEYEPVKELHSILSADPPFVDNMRKFQDLKKELSQLIEEYEREKPEPSILATFLHL